MFTPRTLLGEGQITDKAGAGCQGEEERDERKQTAYPGTGESTQRQGPQASDSLAESETPSTSGLALPLGAKMMTLIQSSPFA